MKALYVTADAIGTASGGGIVTRNELEALRSISDQVTVLERKDLELLGPEQSPYLHDYFALQVLRGLATEFDLAHLYSGCFTETIRYLRAQGTLVTVTCPAHDRKVTVEEFHRQGLEYPYPHIKDDRLWHWFSGGLREASFVIAPSNLSADFLKSEGCNRIEVIPHGCTVPERTAPLPASLCVGYLGQFGPDKGVAYLLAAWEKLNYRDATLVMAGRWGNEVRTYISQHINSGQYRLLGPVDTPRQLYDACSAYIQPSVCEAFGLEVLEAMAHGRPVIASLGAGASELVEDGITGFTVPPRDPQAIAERIDWFKRNPQRLHEMGLKAREKAARFTWEEIHREYQQIWMYLLK